MRLRNFKCTDGSFAAFGFFPADADATRFAAPFAAAPAENDTLENDFCAGKSRFAAPFAAASAMIAFHFDFQPLEMIKF